MIRVRNTYLFFCEATKEASAPRIQRIQEAGTAFFAAEKNWVSEARGGGRETNTSSNCSLAKTETRKRKKSGKPDFTATLSDNERFVVVVVVSLSLSRETSRLVAAASPCSGKSPKCCKTYTLNLKFVSGLGSSALRNRNWNGHSTKNCKAKETRVKKRGGKESSSPSSSSSSTPLNPRRNKKPPTQLITCNGREMFLPPKQQHFKKEQKKEREDKQRRVTADIQKPQQQQ